MRDSANFSPLRFVFNKYQKRTSMRLAYDSRIKKTLPPIKIKITNIDLQRAKVVLEDDLISFMKD
jgi:hypothetical protein